MLDGETYWPLVAADLGVELGRDRIEELIREDSESWLRLNDRMVDWLVRLVASGAPTAILSNMGSDVWRLARKGFGWLDGLTQVTLSFEVGSIKPEPEIYLSCLAGLGVEPGDALFVDDRRENVEAAARIGMRAILYDGEDRLAEELTALGAGLPLP